jgi:hypothetical protein
MKKKNSQFTTHNSPLSKDELTEFLLYTAPNGDVKVEIIFHNETVWLTQKRMAELFGVDVSTINEHLKNIYKTGELEESATIGKFPIVQIEGNREVSRELNCYNLDVILAVGYRVKSPQGTKFRIWATKRIHEYIVKGFTMDDDRLNVRYINLVKSLCDNNGKVFLNSF